MYIDMNDFNNDEAYSAPPGTWKYFDIKPEHCRRSRGRQHWQCLDILVPEVKAAFEWRRKNSLVRLSLPSNWDEVPCIYYKQILAAPTWLRLNDEDSFHDVFCTDEELEGFLRLRWPKMTDEELELTLTDCRNERFRDRRTGLLRENINIPEPYRSKLYSGAFDAPWSKNVL